jgi:hypothetical protein
MCLSPDGGMQWKVGQGYKVPGKRPFSFSGKVALLVSMSKEELMADERFEDLVRDGVVV